MNEFTASNGFTVASDPDNHGRLWVRGEPDKGPDDWLYEEHEVALREFFEHEKDERLGRWRWPEDPDVVIYASPESAWIKLLRESSVASVVVNRGELRRVHPDWKRAVDAYLKVHGSHESAKVGEVWMFGDPQGHRILGWRTNEGTWDVTGSRANELSVADPFAWAESQGQFLEFVSTRIHPHEEP